MFQPHLKVTHERPVDLEWKGPTEFTFDGERFVTDMSWKDRKKTDAETFTVVKNQKYFSFYEDAWQAQPKSIFEIGFFEGGSSVFFVRYFNPDSLTCVDRRTLPIDPVHDYIVRHDRIENFRMIYGFDQGDVEGLRDLARTHHDAKLDMVIDDASHQYDLTKKTFSALFPMVNPGGLYVIEDHGWAHDKRFQDPDHVWAKNPSLVNLIFEMTMVNAGYQGMIASLYIDRSVVVVTRGPDKWNGLYNPSEHYIARGASLQLI